MGNRLVPKWTTLAFV